MRLPFLYFLLAVLCCFAINCGGGGGGGSSSGSSSSIRTAFKANDLYKAQVGDRIVITELGSASSILDQVVSTPSDTVTVELNPNEDYVLAIYAFNNMPAWRTMIMSEQLQSAQNNQGEVDLGELNALTTFSTGVIEVELNKSRSKPNFKARAKTLTKNILQSWFGSSVTTMADLAYDSQLPTTTDQFYTWKNRMQLLMVYLEIVSGFSTSPEASEIQAMQELYASIFDADSTTNLVSKLSSPALPTYPVDGQSIVSELESQSLLFSDEGVLSADELYKVFFKANESAGLLLKVLQPPNAKISGSIAGFQSSGINVTAEHEQYSDLTTSLQTNNDGSYQFTGMVSGNWILKPSQTDMVFDPSSLKVTLLASQSSTGLDFTSFQVVLGSNVVPETYQVLSGVEYISATGNNTLTGSLVLPPASSVLSTESYSDGTGNLQSGTLNVSSVSKKTIPAHQTSQNTNGTITIRH